MKRELILLDLKLVMRYHGLSLLILGLAVTFLMVVLQKTLGLILVGPLMFVWIGLSPLASDPNRKPGEFRHYAVVGADYKEIILAKNISVMILFGTSAGVASVAVFFLTDFDWLLVAKIGIYFLITGFPFLVIGNYWFALKGFSCGGRGGLGYLLLHAISLCLGSLPFAIVCIFFRSYQMIIFLGCLQGLGWYLSLHHVKRLLESRISCLSS